MKKKISIITPSYNSEEWIKSTYQSIRLQTFENWEWVITDDCSTDSTISVLGEIIISDPRVKLFINKVNSGAAVSRNNSISHSEGDFIVFIDSDDLWLPLKLEKQIRFMEENDIDFCFTAYELIDKNSKLIGQEVDTQHKTPITYEEMLCKKATVGCSTVMLRRSAFKDISMPLIRTGQDYGLWLKLLKTGVKAYPLSDILTQYRILPDSISRNKYKKAKRQWQIYREIERLSILKSIKCFCFYAWRAVFRK